MLLYWLLRIIYNDINRICWHRSAFMDSDNSMGTQDTIRPISGKKRRAAEIQRGIFFSLLCMVMLLVTASSSASNASTSTPKKSQSISTSNGVITYSASPQDVLIRTFYGGGELATVSHRTSVSLNRRGNSLPCADL